MVTAASPQWSERGRGPGVHRWRKGERKVAQPHDGTLLSIEERGDCDTRDHADAL